MKIAVFLRDLNSGGAEKMMVGFINHLCQTTSHDVYLILSRNRGPYMSMVDPKVKIVVLGKERSIASVIPLFMYLRKNRVDVLYSTLLNANLTSILIGKLLAIKVIIREANTISEFKKSNRKTKDSITLSLIKYVYGFAHRCIAISNIVKSDLLNYTGLPSEKINVIYNPLVIVDDLSSAVLEDDFFHIGLVSRLSAQKNIPTIVEIIETFSHKPYKIKFHFFGEGEQVSLLNALKEKCKPSLIEIHGFQLSYYSYIKQMNLFIHLPLWEGLGNSVLEVFNAGIPMILSDIRSGYSELIDADQPNVHYFEPTGKVRDIVNLIERYINKEIVIESNREKLKLKSSDIFQQYKELAEC
ncbi:glycosyltransferase [Spirosoma sp.]|uniref:glycosyltransferase n=1 Tax=Spirosoma sp. TaxID=1899569 RepID=UPI00262D1200|nr:glycosyltransferase [Spirosoma sp.]MCX6218962.1 glycosyltransferase [Spirosoma sp.]